MVIIHCHHVRDTLTLQVSFTTLPLESVTVQVIVAVGSVIILSCCHTRLSEQREFNTRIGIGRVRTRSSRILDIPADNILLVLLEIRHGNALDCLCNG